jgi:hypothetical protein
VNDALLCRPRFLRVTDAFGYVLFAADQINDGIGVVDDPYDPDFGFFNLYCGLPTWQHSPSTGQQ